MRERERELREEHTGPRLEWWTQRQAVVELDISMRTLHRYIVGGLGTYAVQGTVYVNTEDLLALWREKRTKTRGTQAVTS